ncbi:MAG: hypothetical protein LBC63_06845 [Holophagales bacterium]|jgi:carbamoylphosphate synthase small subunit|nr:hypothetical protein [Holophagales bacterium]
MDVVTIELFDLTVSQALQEVQRVMDANPASAIRILLDDEMHKHNVIKLLDKHGRAVELSSSGQLVTIDVKAINRPKLTPPAQVIPADYKPLRTQPVLILSGSIGAGDPNMGRRLLLEILRRADKQIPWVGIAFEGGVLLRDPAGAKVLRGLVSAGVPVKVSRECQMFYPDETEGFEVMEDSEWQTMLLKGNATKF